MNKKTEEKCYLEYVDGYLTCTYNHKIGEDCLMNIVTDGSLMIALSEKPTNSQPLQDKGGWEAEFDALVQPDNVVIYIPNNETGGHRDVDVDDIKKLISKVESQAIETAKAEERRKVIEVAIMTSAAVFPSVIPEDLDYFEEKMNQILSANTTEEL